MDNSKKETILFVAIPGADPYKEIPKTQVKDQLAKGMLKQSALIWSQKHNAWKQARHITQLLATKLPVRSVQPRLSTQAEATPVAHAQVTPHATSHSPQATDSIPTEAVVDYTLPSHSRSALWLKLICGALVFIIVALLALNWIFVNHTIQSNLARNNSAFGGTTLYAHLGGFFQANDLVIHLSKTSQVTPKNFVDYLSELSLATPPRPFSDSPFETVSLANGWSADYRIAGIYWKRLSRSDLSDEQKRNLLLENLYVAGGSKLIPPNNFDSTGRLKLETKAWNDFVATFLKH